MWLDNLENIDQDIGEAHCESAGLKATPTIHHANFFVKTVCSNWKMHASNVWAHTHCQPFLQSVSTTFSQSRQLFCPSNSVKNFWSAVEKFLWTADIFFLTKTQGRYPHSCKSEENILGAMFSCRNVSFLQLIDCRKRLLQ